MSKIKTKGFILVTIILIIIAVLFSIWNIKYSIRNTGLIGLSPKITMEDSERAIHYHEDGIITMELLIKKAFINDDNIEVPPYISLPYFSTADKIVSTLENLRSTKKRLIKENRFSEQEKELKRYFQLAKDDINEAKKLLVEKKFDTATRKALESDNFIKFGLKKFLYSTKPKLTQENIYY